MEAAALFATFVINVAFSFETCSIRVGRSIQSFGLSPGITKEQRLGVEKVASSAFSKFTGNLSEICS